MSEITTTEIGMFAQFKDRTLEQTYQRFEHARNVEYLRRIVLFGGLFFFSYFALDLAFTAQRDTLPFIFLCRAFPLVFCSLPLYFAASTVRSPVLLGLLASLFEFIAYLCYLVVLPLQNSHIISSQAMYVILFILVVHAIPNSVANNLITSALLMVGYFLVATVTQPETIDEVILYQLTAFAMALFFAAMSSRQIGKLKRQQFLREQQLQVFSYTDSLTGARNRAYFALILGNACREAESACGAFSLILFDLDDFKQVNDSLGHDAGDSVLVGVTERALSFIRKSDVLARWGGEEFMVLLPGAPPDVAEAIAERIRRSLESTPFGEAGTVTASFGVTQHRPGDAPESILKRADLLLYQAKHSGKNCVQTG